MVITRIKIGKSQTLFVTAVVSAAVIKYRTYGQIPVASTKQTLPVKLCHC